MNCTADVRADSCDVWASTQMQTLAQAAAAQASGLPPEKVHIHSQFMGGGFGRRGMTDFVTEAVEVSKAIGAPVKVTWSREDDMHHDNYRPASYSRFAAGLDADGWPVAWSNRVVSPSITNTSGQPPQNGHRPDEHGRLARYGLRDPEQAGGLPLDRGRHSGDLLASGRVHAEHVFRGKLHG